MIVAVDGKYKDIITELNIKGFQVVGINTKKRIDAVLYNSDYDKGFIDNINESSLTNAVGNQGVLIIDIKNKTLNEVETILRKRLYSPLF